MHFGVLTATAVVGATLLGACSPEPAATPALAAPTGPLSDGVLALDTHVDIPLDFATASVDPRTADLQVNLDKMVQGGLDAAFFIVYVGQTARTPENYAQAQADAAGCSTPPARPALAGSDAAVPPGPTGPVAFVTPS